MRDLPDWVLYSMACEGNHTAMVEIGRRKWDVSAHNCAPNAGALLWYRNAAALGNKVAIALVREIVRDFPGVASALLDRPVMLPGSRRVLPALKLAA